MVLGGFYRFFLPLVFLIVFFDFFSDMRPCHPRLFPEVLLPDVPFPDVLFPDALFPDVLFPGVLFPDVLFSDVLFPDVLFPDVRSAAVRCVDMRFAGLEWWQRRRHDATPSTSSGILYCRTHIIYFLFCRLCFLSLF